MALIYGLALLVVLAAGALAITILAIVGVVQLRRPRAPRIGPVSRTWLNNH